MCQEYLSSLAALLVLLCLQNGDAQIATIDLRVENLLQMQQGIGWPLQLYVAEGNEALMRLTDPLVNHQLCEVTTPTGIKFNVSNPPNDRYQSWSDGCGVRVRHVEHADSGRWRLTASRANDLVTGWTEVYVEERIEHYAPSAISLKDGQQHTEVELTSLNNSYCLVAQPFTESALIPGHCRVTLDRATRAVQGNWNVLLGISGRVEELQVQRTVAVQAERLDVGYVREGNKLHLYCNILHTAKNITFCRFQKSTASSGFNVMDGLSDGRFSYYGDGFFKRQCGLTIESVSADDYGSWRCTVGVREWVGNTIQQRTPMQALISVPMSGSRIKRDNERTDDELKTLFVQKDSSFTINCQADASLAYCWFQHPNGSQFTHVERQTEEEQEFWYTGKDLQTGECGITFAHVSDDDAGIWTCHMGYRYQLGVEITDKVAVRVTGPLAANNKEVGARIGGEATLYCHTANGPKPLDYCRFLAPNFVGFRLDSSVTAENAILDRFYFTPERNLDYGDCSLTINPVLNEDIGEWTCAGLLHDNDLESRDTISVLVDSTSRSARFQAGIAGMVIGIVGLAVVLAGTVWYKKGKPLPWPRARFSNTTETVTMEMQSQRTSTSTSNSDDRLNF